MVIDILDPLTEYANVYEKRFAEVAKSTFDELAAEAQVDEKANLQTCTQIYKEENKLSALKKRIKHRKIGRVLLWLGIIGVIIYVLVAYQDMEAKWLVFAAVTIVFALVYIFAVLNPTLKEMKSAGQKLEYGIIQLKEIAWKQMRPLLRLYDWDILTRMIMKTVPKIEFDPYFTTKRLADLKATYHWNESFNEGRSVLFSHSGLINGNPFVICRTRKMVMGTMTYKGTKTISWTTTESDGNGRTRTVHHSEVLRATVTAPYPEYPETTHLIYGNTAAPNLMFYRKKSGLANKEDSLSYKWKRRSLRKKARDLKNANYAMMTNEEFEVIFNTSNRNDNQQYALLFTPLAQENMTKILKDTYYGYGDDFNFYKERMINIIEADHMQELNLDMDPREYYHFDFRYAKIQFLGFNKMYFRAIYFALAPLLSIPMYQQIRPQEAIYGRDMEQHSSFWEHEAIANFWGQKHFQHPDCVTKCVLKTDEVRTSNDSATLTVHAYGYRAEKRISYISVHGGDGRWHDVPVEWYEYFPVEGSGQLHLTEDNLFKDGGNITNRERREHIDSVLNQTSMMNYRRHIASRV